MPINDNHYMRITYGHLFCVFCLIVVILSCFAVSGVSKFKNCEKEFERKNFGACIACYEKNISKIKFDNAGCYARFEYGFSLIQLAKYKEAKAQFELIASNCVDSNHIEGANKNLKILDDELNKIEKIKEYKNERERRKEQYARMDYGDYYSDVTDSAKWRKPKGIKVFIPPKDPMIQTIKSAFDKWDKALYSMVNFIYVTNEKEADIMALTRSQADVAKTCGIPMAVGCTNHWTYHHKDRPSNVYFRKALISIAPVNPNSEPSSESAYLGVVLHEIGHAIGILSHSPIQGDAMYKSTDGFKTGTGEISNRDVNTVKRIYGDI